MYRKFVDFAGAQGVHDSSEEIILARHTISVTLYANIARYTLGNLGYYSIIQEIEPPIQKSLEIFSKNLGPSAFLPQ
jgi:hypothetical protein